MSSKKENIKEVAEEITVKDEKDESFYDEKEKGKVIRIIWNILFYGVIAVFAFCAIFGVINFNKVQDGNEPTGYASTKTYTEDSKNVTVYNYYAYKIVKVSDSKTGQNTVSLKLWFLDDIN